MTTAPVDAEHDTRIKPFSVHVPESEIVDLRSRLEATRWPDSETVDDRSQGVPLSFLTELCCQWARDYDWRRVETRLNAMPQFVTSIDGLDVHFMHVTSPHAGATPLLMIHGWPGSIVEFLDVATLWRTPWRLEDRLRTPSTWCARRCPDSGSVADRRHRAGAAHARPGHSGS